MSSFLNNSLSANFSTVQSFLNKDEGKIAIIVQRIELLTKEEFNAPVNDEDKQEDCSLTLLATLVRSEDSFVENIMIYYLLLAISPLLLKFAAFKQNQRYK